MIRKQKPPTAFLLALALVAFILPACQPDGQKPGPPVRLGSDVENTIRTALASVPGPVTLHFYTGGTGETAARETRAVLDFIEDTSSNIDILEHAIDGLTGADEADSGIGVDHGTVIKIVGANKGTMLFYGYPERKELPPLLDGILMASGHPVDLPADAISYLDNLGQDILIRIFTTPD